MRIVLADDHTMFRQSLRAFLEREGMEIVAEAANGVDALRLTRVHDPDAVVLDMNMPQLNGVEVAAQLRRHGVRAKVVILTMFEEEVTVLEAFRAGVQGYVLKTLSSSDLIKALRELAQGRHFLSSGIADTVVEGWLRQEDNSPGLLTSRERQILQLVAEGNASKEIARILNLTLKTVESHRNRLMRKLDATNIAGLVRSAVKLGVIPP